MEEDRAAAYLKSNRQSKDTLYQKVSFFLFDLVLIAGFLVLSFRIYEDRDYWKTSPYPLDVFIVVQYAMLALLFRLAISKVSPMYQSAISCLLLTVVKVYAWICVYWLNEIRLQSEFTLKDEYKLEVTVLAGIPVSLMVVVSLIIIKFLWVQTFCKKQRYGNFNDEPS